MNLGSDVEATLEIALGMILTRCPELLEVGGALLSHLRVFHLHFELEISCVGLAFGLGFILIFFFFVNLLDEIVLLTEPLVEFFDSFTD